MSATGCAHPAFGLVVARWLLTQAEVRALLGSEPCGEAVQPGRLDAAGMARADLLVALEAGLRAILGERRTAAWVREPSASFGGEAPVVAMADEAVLRALVRVVLGRDGPVAA